MPRRKVFDKKTATTFSLVHRAQNDPLINDENAPSMVFTEKQAPARRSAGNDEDDDDYTGSSASSVISGTSSSSAYYRSKKTRQRGDLEDEFGFAFKKNEGEAAQHGVFFDDTQYDYMQHMRDLGSGEQGGPVTWVEANAPANKKGKGKQPKLEDALRSMDLDGRSSVGGDSVASSARSLLPEEVLPSEFVRRRTYQDQQDVPDEIAGFQPDMDPRLREVLEALEDEEYVDDEEDIFAALTGDGPEVERDEWERLGEQWGVDEDDEGWESDDTIRAASPPPALAPALSLPEGEDAKPPEDVQAQPPADPTEGAWLDEFKKFKSDVKAGKTAGGELSGPSPAGPAAPSALDASVLSSLASGRRKKRKGAKTSTTNYSMTSSALARTDHQTLLDSRFDKIIENEDEAFLAGEEDDAASQINDTSSLASGMTGLSKASKASSRYSNISGLSGVSGISSYSRATDSEAPQLTRADFDGIMDDFLGAYSKTGKAGRRIRRGAPQTGMEQLDEVRSGLGPARLKSKGVAARGMS